MFQNLSISLLSVCLLMSACKAVAAEPAPQCNKQSILKLSVTATGIHLLRFDDIRRLTGCAELQPAAMRLSSQGREVKYAITGGLSGDEGQAGDEGQTGIQQREHLLAGTLCTGQHGCYTDTCENHGGRYVRGQGYTAQVVGAHGKRRGSGAF